MNVTTDLTRVPPSIHLTRNDWSDEELWYLEIFPARDDGSECVTFLVDSPADALALGQAIVDAAERASARAVRP